MFRYLTNSAKGAYQNSTKMFFAAAGIILAAKAISNTAPEIFHEMNRTSYDTTTAHYQTAPETIDQRYGMLQTDVNLDPVLVERAIQVEPIVEQELATGKYPYLASMDAYGGDSVAAVMALLARESSLEHYDPQTGDVKLGVPYGERGIGQILDPAICDMTEEQIRTLAGNIQCSISYLDEGIGLKGSFYHGLGFYNGGFLYGEDLEVTERVEENYIKPVMEYYKEFRKLG